MQVLFTTIVQNINLRYPFYFNITEMCNLLQKHYLCVVNGMLNGLFFSVFKCNEWIGYPLWSQVLSYCMVISQIWFNLIFQMLQILSNNTNTIILWTNCIHSINAQFFLMRVEYFKISAFVFIERYLYVCINLMFAEEKNTRNV